jgi:hypothetical protein
MGEVARNFLWEIATWKTGFSSNGMHKGERVKGHISSFWRISQDIPLITTVASLLVHIQGTLYDEEDAPRLRHSAEIMRIWLLASVLLALLSSVLGQLPSTGGEIDVRKSNLYDGKALEIPISGEHGIQLYQQWMEQAFSGLFAAVASKK